MQARARWNPQARSSSGGQLKVAAGKAITSGRQDSGSAYEASQLPLSVKASPAEMAVRDKGRVSLAFASGFIGQAELLFVSLNMTGPAELGRARHLGAGFEISLRRDQGHDQDRGRSRTAAARHRAAVLGRTVARALRLHGPGEKALAGGREVFGAGEGLGSVSFTVVGE